MATKANGSTDTNPWLSIPAADYEGHMSRPEVGQLQALSAIFSDVLTMVRPARICVVGCATGNGFEHIDPALTSYTLGIDINPEYLKVARQRYGARLPGLELRQGDVLACDLPLASFDLLHAALIFEYVDPRALVPRLASALAPGGTLCAVLQLPSAAVPEVTPTPYTSLGALSAVMRLLAPERLCELCSAASLELTDERRVDLHSGKQFWRGLLKLAER